MLVFVIAANHDAARRAALAGMGYASSLDAQDALDNHPLPCRSRYRVHAVQVRDEPVAPQSTIPATIKAAAVATSFAVMMFAVGVGSMI